MEPLGTINITLPGKQVAMFISHQFEIPKARYFQLSLQKMLRIPMFSR